MSIRNRAKSFLSLEQIAAVESIFTARGESDQIFEILYGYSENKNGPEYYNWRLLLDELGTG